MYHSRFNNREWNVVTLVSRKLSFQRIKIVTLDITLGQIDTILCDKMAYLRWTCIKSSRSIVANLIDIQLFQSVSTELQECNHATDLSTMDRKMFQVSELLKDLQHFFGQNEFFLFDDQLFQSDWNQLLIIGLIS